MITDISEVRSIDIDIDENYDVGGGHYKYEGDTAIEWNIQRIDIKKDIVRMRVERVADGESEIYDTEGDGDYRSSYMLKISEIFDIDISKDVILEALRTKYSVDARIFNSKYISGEILDYTYIDGEKLTKNEIADYALYGSNMDGEHILVSAWYV